MGTRKMDSVRGYDLWAGSYDAMDNPLIAMVEQALLTHPEMAAGKRVLELGCGTARNAGYFLERGAVSYTGVDGSEGMLAQGRARWGSEKRVTLVRGDIAGELGVTREGFDLLFVSLVLEHLAEVGRIFDGAMGCLVHGGRIRILELHPDRQREGTAAHFYHEGEDHLLPSYPHDGEELRRVLENAGAEAVEARAHIPNEGTLAKSQRVGKYRGMPLLLDVSGIRR